MKQRLSAFRSGEKDPSVERARVHKVTPLNDSSSLSALSRTFATFRGNFQVALTRRSDEDGRPTRTALRPAEAEKRPKQTAHFPIRNETFRMAKRNSLKSFWPPNSLSRGLFIFKDLTPISFRRFTASLVFNDLLPFRFVALAIRARRRAGQSRRSKRRD